jgi:hypothetical protein
MGFRGQACSGCAGGFFPSAGSCASCPRLSAALAQLVPLFTFGGALLALGVALAAAAQAALSRGGRAPPPCRDAEGAPRAVFSLIVWVWTSAQGAAALFSQTLDAGLVPAPLLPAFSALAALQFVGVTLAPACYISTPFQGFWASAGLVCGALAGLAAAAAALPAARPETRHARALHALLKASALLLTVGYGAYVNAAVTVLTCRLPAPMSVAEYLRAASDGRALAEALRGGSAPAPPPLAALRAAAEDPFLAQQLGVAPLLRTAIPVSLLASDPFTVCREGAHGAAWPAAAALAALLLGGVPLLGLWALCGAGRLKGLRRALQRRRASPAAAARSLPAPRPALAHLTGVLVDPSLRPPFAWLTFFNMLLTALCSGGVALAQRAASPAQFIGLQAALIAGPLASAVLVARARPFLERERWRGPVQVALYLLAAASASVNLAMRFAGEAAARGPLGWGLASSLLALAATTLVLLFGGWWWALVARARASGAVGGGASAAAAAAAAAAAEAGAPPFAVANPLAAMGPPPPLLEMEVTPRTAPVEEEDGAAGHPPNGPPSSAQPLTLVAMVLGPAVGGWLPVRDVDGDSFWVAEATNETAWLHPGAGFEGLRAGEARAPPVVAGAAAAAGHLAAAAAAVAVQRVVRGRYARRTATKLRAAAAALEVAMQVGRAAAAQAGAEVERRAAVAAAAAKRDEAERAAAAQLAARAAELKAAAAAAARAEAARLTAAEEEARAGAARAAAAAAAAAAAVNAAHAAAAEAAVAEEARAAAERERQWEAEAAAAITAAGGRRAVEVARLARAREEEEKLGRAMAELAEYRRTHGSGRFP